MYSAEGLPTEAEGPWGVKSNNKSKAGPVRGQMGQKQRFGIYFAEPSKSLKLIFWPCDACCCGACT